MGKASTYKRRRREAEAARAREIIERGLEPEEQGRPVKPHRSGGGSMVGLILDEAAEITRDALVRVPKLQR